MKKKIIRQPERSYNIHIIPDKPKEFGSNYVLVGEKRKGCGDGASIYIPHESINEVVIALLKAKEMYDKEMRRD